jgi:hypothetical protein
MVCLGLRCTLGLTFARRSILPIVIVIVGAENMFVLVRIMSY